MPESPPLAPRSTVPSIEQEELRGISRTVAEIEWLLLVLVLVFTHGGVLEMLRRHAQGMGLAAPRDFEVPNAALNWFETDAQSWRVLAWADTGHLDAALDDLRE